MSASEDIPVGWFLLIPGGAQEALIEWFRTLHFRHTVGTHILLVASLDWPELREVFALAAPGGNYDVFALGVLREARLAREAGKVVPSGISRQPGGGRKPKHARGTP